jgi:hypothetical protein
MYARVIPSAGTTTTSAGTLTTCFHAATPDLVGLFSLTQTDVVTANWPKHPADERTHVPESDVRIASSRSRLAAGHSAFMS